MLLGVSTLTLSHSNLTGSIEALDLSALALSLTRLDLSGAFAGLPGYKAAIYNVSEF